MQVDVNGRSVYAYTGGRDVDPAQASIVFVHGACNDHSVWALQSRYFAHHGRNVLAVDTPGHGRSAGDAHASVSDIADWLVALLDALAIERAAFVGHSLGALSVLDMAARNCTRVSRIALLGPSAPMPVAEALLDAAKANDHVAFELITGWSFSAAHQLGGSEQPGIWMSGNALRLMERSRPGVLYNDLLACRDYNDGVNAAGGIHCSSLVMLGQRDLMAPPANATLLIEALADKRVVTLSGCGHSLMAEAPRAVLDALRAFLP
ncbi:MAG TPA: alpha/beta hydrolase [Casimicrobiaceae bacterium]|nr:alpha/beta hydrolase [Casimicrobiaceae bacterium]